MNNNTMNKIATAQQNLTQQINILEKAHKNSQTEGLRLENGQLKLGPKYVWKTQFLKTIRPIISFITPLVDIIDSKLYSIDRINTLHYEQAKEHIEKIAFFGKAKIKTRKVTITEAKKHILSGQKSIAEDNRITPPYLNKESVHSLRVHKPTNHSYVLPDYDQMLLNVERDYRIETDEKRIENKLKRANKSASEQPEMRDKTLHSLYRETYNYKKKGIKDIDVHQLINNPEDNQIYSEQPNKGEIELSLPKADAEAIKNNFFHKNRKKRVDAHKCTLSYHSEKETSSGISHSKGLILPLQGCHAATKIALQTLKENGDCSIVGVFDGHMRFKEGAIDAARYMSKKIPEYLETRLDEFNEEGLTDTGIWNAIKIAFVDANNSYYEKTPDHIFSGTTANVTITMPNGDIWVANCGDSRAILIDPNGKTIQMSEEANPGDKKYQQQVESRGSRVVIGKDGYNDKVDDELSVSRTLGDHDFYGAVTARPKITKFAMPENGWIGYTLLQVCDGVTDVFSTKQAGEIVYASLNSGDSKAVAAAKLTAAAYRVGSEDNITSIVTPLG